MISVSWTNIFGFLSTTEVAMCYLGEINYLLGMLFITLILSHLLNTNCYFLVFVALLFEAVTN